MLDDGSQRLVETACHTNSISFRPAHSRQHFEPNVRRTNLWRSLTEVISASIVQQSVKTYLSNFLSFLLSLRPAAATTTTFGLSFSFPILLTTSIIIIVIIIIRKRAPFAASHNLGHFPFIHRQPTPALSKQSGVPRTSTTEALTLQIECKRHLVDELPGVLVSWWEGHGRWPARVGKETSDFLHERGHVYYTVRIDDRYGGVEMGSSSSTCGFAAFLTALLLDQGVGSCFEFGQFAGCLALCFLFTVFLPLLLEGGRQSLDFVFLTLYKTYVGVNKLILS